MAVERITLQGHLLDQRLLSRTLDEILATGASYRIETLDLGEGREDQSVARLKIELDDAAALAELVGRLQNFGANPDADEDARVVTAEVDGAFPPGFYSTTNLDTDVRLGGRWVSVWHPEMDCGIVVEDGRARTIPMGEAKAGMDIVMAGNGIRVHQLEAPTGAAKQAFEFMSSDLSSEKPKSLMVEKVAQQMRDVRAAGKRIMWVAGPAVVHTGSAPDVAALVRGGYVNAFFAGNGVAAHDIESNLFGTSLGVHLDQGTPAEHGHEHHIRAVNEVRTHGSFAAAIEAGMFSDGIVYHLVKHNVPYLFGGSVRDDGPLPDVVTDMIEVQARLRQLIWGEEGDDLIGYCIVVGTMLHGIATGNCLPASVPLVCVDINQATVTKLMDRGSWQSVGIITDLGLFIRTLAQELCPDELRDPSEDARVRAKGSRTRR